MSENDGSLRPERILHLSERLSAVAGAKIGEIAYINREAKMLAINALIVAARAGEWLRAQELEPSSPGQRQPPLERPPPGAQP